MIASKSASGVLGCTASSERACSEKLAHSAGIGLSLVNRRRVSSVEANAL